MVVEEKQSLAKATDFIAYPFDKNHKRKMVSALMKEGNMRHDINTWIIGICTCILTGVVAFRWPQHYWILHVVKMCYYFSYRYYDFKKVDQEYYMLEFCYIVNAVISAWCIFQLFRTQIFGVEAFTPYNSHAIRAGFAFSNGGLAWSILVFRNSLVLHDRGQLSSTFIHISPAIMGWCLRWNAMLPHEWIGNSWPYVFNVCGDENPVDVDNCNKFWCNDICEPGSLIDFIWFPVASYAVWMVIHGLFTQVFFKDYLTRNNKTHLYDYMKANPDPLMKMLWGSARKCGLPDSVVYYLTHFTVNVILGCLSWVYWQSFALHTTWMFLLAFMACVNGAGYTFKIFAVRYAPLKFKQLGYIGVALGSEEETSQHMQEVIKKAGSKVHPEPVDSSVDEKYKRSTTGSTVAEVSN